MFVHSAYLFSLTGLPAGAYRKTSRLNYAKLLFNYLLFIYLFFLSFTDAADFKADLCMGKSEKFCFSEYVKFFLSQ